MYNIFSVTDWCKPAMQYSLNIVFYLTLLCCYYGFYMNVSLYNEVWWFSFRAVSDESTFTYFKYDLPTFDYS